MKSFYFLAAFAVLLGCSAQEYQVTFKVDMASEEVKEVGIRGNVSPLSENKDYPLSDKNGDGIYEVTLTFKTSKKNLRFKFTNGESSELRGSDNRILWFKTEPLNAEYVYNEYLYHSPERIDELNYSATQIKEDVAVLSETIQYIHPNIYRYIDSVSLQKEFETLENVINQNPNITTVYKEVSRFLAKVKCSHAFTNPWNQGPDVKRGLFFQPDKIPFTFQRIGKRIFIDKNASDNELLKTGWEIDSINGTSTDEVLDRLAAYVTSDGNNYEKKLERLVVLEEDKFSLFDIFYPLEFGSPEVFDLSLSNTITGDTVRTTVSAVSKTYRTKKLIEKYGDIKVSFSDGWKFELLDGDIGLLSINSFAVQGKNFDWEEFLDSAFKELNNKQAQALIIDIRDNEGGQGEVAEYILERIIQKPLAVPAMQSSVRYLTIPESFEKHISTWAKFPYSFKGKYEYEENGRYFLKDKYSVEAQTYKPRKDGFKGKVYLITGPQNSSATHLMASYASIIDGVTLVGRETGGNVQGLNANFIFFLRLPNSRVEIDIPVVHMWVPLKELQNRDGGIIPDLPFEIDPKDLLNNRDTILEELLDIIRA
jgi:hypothetical protein